MLLIGVSWCLLTLVLIGHAHNAYREGVIKQLEYRLKQHEQQQRSPIIVPRRVAA